MCYDLRAIFVRFSIHFHKITPTFGGAPMKNSGYLTITFLLLTGFSLMVLTGCGSDAGESDFVRDINTLQVASLEPAIAADGVSSTVIRAVVSGANNQPVQGLTVTFHTSQGTITPAVQTDYNGVANARLVSSTSEVTAQITATAGTLSQTVNVNFVRALTMPGRVDLLISRPQINSAGTERAVITAVVKDQDNILIPGIDVRFLADNDGTLRVIRATSDENGTAEAEISAEGSKANRNINLWARARGVEGSNRVQVVGTHILTSGTETGVLNSSISLELALRDSDGNPIPGKLLNVASGGGNLIDNPSPVTSSGGNATLNIRLTTAGEDTITIAGEGATAVHNLRVFADRLEFITPLPEQDIPLGLTAPVTVRLSNADGVPQEGQTIFFSVTRGTLSQNQIVTNAAGEAQTSIQATSAGSSVLTASVVNGPSVQVALSFVATQPRFLNLQAVPAVIGTNAAGEDSARSNIYAVLRDPNNNLVKSQIIDFNLHDISGGRLTHSFSITDQYGRASTNYVAGAVASGLDGVVITARVRNSPDVRAEVKLTVAESAVFIKLGTGNLVIKPDADQPQRILYQLPYSVLLTDIAGGPVRNAELTLSLWPLSYSQGYYYRVYDGDSFKFWAQRITQGPIPNEDANRNGIMDPGEDVNRNGRLDPGHVATLIPHPDYAVSTTPIRIRTDSSGYAFFDIVYPQEYANWVDMELVARARVSGTEASAVALFTLPILGDDITEEFVAPPGAVSPFGRGTVAAVVGDISLRVGSRILGANGISTTVVRAFVTDISGAPAEGVPVSFQTTLGSVTSAVTTDQNGIADALLTAGTEIGTAVITASAGGFSSQETVQFINIPPGQTAGITLSATPAVISADGNQTSTITAILIDGVGNPAPVGTPVTFSTTHGTFPNGRNTYSTITGAGSVSVQLTAGLTTGRAEITCKSYEIEAVTYIQMVFPQ